MKNATNLRKGVIGAFALYILSLFFSMSAYSQCEWYCDAYSWYGEWDDYISNVYVGDIDNSSSFGYGVNDYTKFSTDMKSGQSYDITVNLGYGYGHEVMVYIDWNQDCDFDDEYESMFLETYDYMKYTGSIYVPTDIPGGTVRMRIRNGYYYWEYFGPCSYTYYGEIEDYTINSILPAPDAGIADIYTPTAPYPEGNYLISAELGSYGDGPLGGCTVNWSVNNVTQTPYYWYGYMSQGETVTVDLGYYNFIYPDGGPYNPFNVRVWVTDIKGAETYLPDTNPGNDFRQEYTSPSTEDAQPVAITQPSGSFAPGNIPIYVQIRNNARKILTKVDIDWYVDGVKQGTKKWTGSLAQGQSQEVMVGYFNFFYKTPLLPFDFEAITVNPNGVVDPIPGNDKVTRSIAPSLIPATYYIGGANAHFPSISGAVSYMNASGILGDGDVFMKINNGTYQEQAILTEFPHGNNHFYFESTSGNANDVHMNYMPNFYNNFIFGIYNQTNITFRNMTFNVLPGGAGTIIYSAYNYDINFYNVIFNGIAGTNDNYSLVRTDNALDLSFNKCNFSKGYNGIQNIYFDYMCNSADIEVKDNKFQDYYNYGIYMMPYSYYQEDGDGEKIKESKSSGTKLQAMYPISIINNEFIGVTTLPQGGVRLADGALVQNNKFDNFVAKSSGYSGILIEDMFCSNGTLVDKNIIMNMSGVSGITAYGSNIVVNRNEIAIKSITNMPVKGIYQMGSNGSTTYNKINLTGITSNTSSGLYFYSFDGLISDNISVVNNGLAFNAEYSNGLMAYYNTLITNSAGFAGAVFVGGTNDFQRNIIVNYGTGRSAIVNNSGIISDKNMIWTKGTTNASDLTAWKNATGDLTSVNIPIELNDDGTYRYYKYYPESQSDYPLGLGPNEDNDYFGTVRSGHYLAGYANINLTLTITKQPQTVLGCVGDNNQTLTTSGKITYGAKANYQWQKDGVDIPGATDPIFKIPAFTYETSGVYRCFVNGPANVKEGMYTDEVMVYTLRQTEITKQPLKQASQIGGTVFFELEVHIKGIVPPFFQHKYQWWRHLDGVETQLMDNEFFANTRSPIMTITNLQDKHFSSVDDYYYCIVEGLCGTVVSDKVKLEMVAGEIVFDVQPIGQDICIADDLNLTANAKIIGGNENIEYRWFFDALALTDGGRISGSGTNTLVITNVGPDDEGRYVCQATADESGKVSNSIGADVKINLPPLIETQPVDQDLKEGENMKLSVIATAIRPMTYQWFKDDIVIDGATSPDFEIQGVTLTHSGFYYCNITNDCGDTKSTVVQVIVSKDGGISSVTDANKINFAVTPNPAISEVNLTFVVENDSQIEVSIVDLTGKKVASKYFEAISGENSLMMKLDETISSGTYFVQLQFNGVIYSRQIVVKK